MLNARQDTSKFTLGQLAAVVEAPTAVNMAQMGDRVVRTDGVPIGFFASKSNCSLVLNECEQ
eukprot:775267-Alexandrium_andersonii.AAC.1